MPYQRLVFNRMAIHYEIAGIAYVAADVLLSADNHHSLHQTFDICEEDNIPRIDNLLNLAFSQAAHALSPLIDSSRPFCKSPSGNAAMTFPKKTVSASLALKIKETVREFLVASALHGWLSVTLPGSAETWKERADTLLAAIQALPLRVGTGGCVRRSSPF